MNFKYIVYNILHWQYIKYYIRVSRVCTTRSTSFHVEPNEI